MEPSVIIMEPSVIWCISQTVRLWSRLWYSFISRRTARVCALTRHSRPYSSLPSPVHLPTRAHQTSTPPPPEASSPTAAPNIDDTRPPPTSSLALGHPPPTPTRRAAASLLRRSPSPPLPLKQCLLHSHRHPPLRPITGSLLAPPAPAPPPVRLLCYLAFYA